MITDLMKVHSLRVLERGHLVDLLRELQLADSKVAVTQTEWASPETTKGVKQRLQVLRRRDSAAPYFRGAIDDARDSAFSDAVKAFQIDRNLSADGKPGPRTQAALQSAVDQAVQPLSSGPVRYVGLVDSASAPRLGHLIRTRRFVKGAFIVLGESEIQLDAFLLDAVTREQTPIGSSVAGDLSSLIHHEKHLVFQTLEALGIEPTEEERLALGRAPTTSFPALLAYSMGLALEDEGKTQEALQSYREAIGYDPAFRQAREARETLEVSPAKQEGIERVELEVTIRPEEPAGSDDIAKELLPMVGVGPAPLDPEGSPSDGSGQGDDQSATDPSKPDEGGKTIPPFPPPPGEH
jgi:tetratricopeptide (TPR) repeat protein